jgi:hypothetical protein
MEIIKEIKNESPEIVDDFNEVAESYKINPFEFI